MLRGMQETLATHRPKVMLELHLHWLPDGVDAAEVEELLTRHGYTSRPLPSEERVRRSLWTP